MLTIKGYDDYLGDKITSTSAIADIKDNEIIFEDGSTLNIKQILKAKEKYNICELNKSIFINKMENEFIDVELAKIKKIKR